MGGTGAGPSAALLAALVAVLMGLWAAGLSGGSVRAGAAGPPGGAAGGSAAAPSASASANAILVKAVDFAFQFPGQPAPKPGQLPLVSVKGTGGELVFRVTNAGMVEHNFVIWDSSERTVDDIPVVGPGQTQELRVRLKPGTYRLVCTYPGHRELGMEAALEVR